MYRSCNVECAHCGNTLRIEYDSHKPPRTDYYKCPCGHLKVSPMHPQGGYSYNGTKDLSIEDTDYVEVYYEEDYNMLSAKHHELINNIYITVSHLDTKHNVIFTNTTTSKELCLKLTNRKGVEQITVKAQIPLVKPDGWTKEEAEEHHKKITTALIRFQACLDAIIEEKVSFDSPKTVWDSDLKWSVTHKDHLELYDYEYNC